LSRRLVEFARSSLAPDTETTLVSFNPIVAAWGRGAWPERTVYFGRDDFATWPPMRRWWPAIEQAYRVIDETADAIFVVSEELRRRVSPARAIVMPNGVSSRVWLPKRPIPAQLRLDRPYAVYAGTIDDRLDLDVVELIASNPIVTQLVMAGPAPNELVRRRLVTLKKVRMLGTLDQESLAAVVQNADVGVIPHVVDRLTTAMSPLKLYEYLAAGLPVVATDLPPIRGHGPRVHLCSTRNEWSSALITAHAQERLTAEKRAAVIDQLSWATRVAPLIDAVVGTKGAAR
jgi:glycosyltransferase involved in cell wall biosynthesis